MSLLNLGILTLCVQIYLIPVNSDDSSESESASDSKPWSRAPGTWKPWSRAPGTWKPWSRAPGTWKPWSRAPGTWKPWSRAPGSWKPWSRAPGTWKSWGNKSSGWKNWGNKSSSGWKNWGNKSSSGWKNWGNRSSSRWKNWGNKSSGGVKPWGNKPWGTGWTRKPYTGRWSKYGEKVVSTTPLHGTTEVLEEVEPVDPRVKLVLKKHGIVPDVIPVAPEHELRIKYVDTVVDLGTVIPPNVTRLAPTLVRWPLDETQHMHTLIMIDPDVPSRKNPWKKEWQHWIVVNIPYGRVWAGEELTEYRGIKECHGPGYHRYIFLVYHQPDNEIIHFTEPRLGVPPVDMDRSHFSTMKFTTKYKLGDPVAGNFFMAKWAPYEDILHPYSPLHNHTIHEKDMINEFQHRFTVADVDHKKNHTDYALEITTEEPDNFDILEHIKNL